MKKLFLVCAILSCSMGSFAGPFDEDSISSPKTQESAVQGSAIPSPEPSPEPSASSGNAAEEIALPQDKIPGLAGQIDLAISRTKKRGIKVTPGADKVNIADLNNWLVHFRDTNGVNKFLTGQEKPFVDAVKAIFQKTGRKLTAGELLEISLKLNNGDVAQSMITIHNAFRQLSRGRDGISGLSQDTGFFHTCLDSAIIGKATPNPGEDISDEWYHFFGMASMSYVGEEKNILSAGKDFITKSKGNDWRANLSTLAGILKGGLNPLSWIPGQGVGTSVAVSDAVGEQVYYGYLATAGEWAAKNRNGNFFHDCWINLKSWGKGFSGIEGDEFGAELRGAGFGTYLSSRV